MEIVVRQAVGPDVVQDPGESLLAILVTEPARNGFPALPVREGEQVVVTVAGFADEAQHARHRELAGEPDGAMQVMRLVPTDRSRLGR
jgi:hypothetical protein